MNGTFDRIARIVFSVGFGGADMEVDKVTGAPRSNRESETGEEGAGGRLFFEGGRGVIVAGDGDHWV